MKNIGFICEVNPEDKRSWSGTNYKITKELKKSYNVIWFNTNTKLIYFFKIIRFFTIKLTGKNYDYNRNILLAKIYAFKIKRLLNKNKNIDLLFASASSTHIAYLKTKIPIIYLTDTSFALLENYYPAFTNLTKLNIANGNKIEQKALNNSKQVICSSNWAANSIINYYNTKKEKVNVIEFGSNIDLKKNLNKPPKNYCQLLFVGVEWERKGGQKAIDTFNEMNKIGVHTKLVIVGSLPKITLKDENITYYAQLDKNKTQEAKILVELYNTSDFFILPTIAECSSIAICEACAFGLPVLTNNTGGLSNYVLNEINGYRFEINETPKNIADFAAKVFMNKPLYNSYSKNAKEIYESKLNWGIWLNKVVKIIENKL